MDATCQIDIWITPLLKDQKKKIIISYSDDYKVSENYVYIRDEQPLEILLKHLLPEYNKQDLLNLVSCIDSKFLFVNDYTQNFKMTVYAYNDNISGVCLEEFDFDGLQEDGNFKGIKYVGYPTHYYRNYKTQKIYRAKDYIDFINDEEDFTYIEEMKVADIRDIIVVESENFFRRYSYEYENYLQEKYKLTPEKLKEYSI